MLHRIGSIADDDIDTWMPDHPPPHLAEPASPLLLDQDLAQATAEAHTYVRHIERYSALAARAAERVRDDTCFCTRSLQLVPSPRAFLSTCATVAAIHPRSQPVLCAHPLRKGRVCCRENAFATKLSAAVQARKVLAASSAAFQGPRLTVAANFGSVKALQVELTALGQRDATGWVSTVVALCRGTSACSVRSLCCCLRGASTFPTGHAPHSDTAQEYVPLSACLAHVPLASMQRPTAVHLSVPAGQPLDDSIVVLVLVSGTHGSLCPRSGWTKQYDTALPLTWRRM